jgi:hypothetical protein
MRLAGFVFVALFAACSADPTCDAMRRGFAAVSASGAPCGQRAYRLDGDTCAEAVSACSDFDRGLVENAYTCMESIPTCDPATDREGSFLGKHAAALAGCSFKAAGASKACLDALKAARVDDGEPADAGAEEAPDAGEPADAGPQPPLPWTSPPPQRSRSRCAW